jgi:hypothetical protein
MMTITMNKLSWTSIPTETIPTPKNYDPDKKVPTMPVPTIPTLISTPTISMTGIPIQIAIIVVTVKATLCLTLRLS